MKNLVAVGSSRSHNFCAMQTQVTRRAFLKTGSAVALGTPLLLSSAWAAAGGKGPNERITLGFIGTGTQGRGLLNNFLRQPDTRVLALCDVDTTRREHHKKIVDTFYSDQQTGESKACADYKDFRDLLARKDIDAVVIAAPDH